VNAFGRRFQIHDLLTRFGPEPRPHGTPHRAPLCTSLFRDPEFPDEAVNPRRSLG
jgi:hypothetical protein